MKAPEVKAYADLLAERLQNAIDAFNRLEIDYKATAQSHADLLRQMDQTIPIIKEAVQDLKKWKEEQEKERDHSIHLKRDIDDLKRWKEDIKKEKDERARRWWSFGPNVVAAIISFVGSLVTLAITFLLIKKP